MTRNMGFGHWLLVAMARKIENLKYSRHFGQLLHLIMCKFLSQAVEQNNISLIALVKCSPSPLRKGVAIWVFCKEAFGPSPISRDGRWCRLGASDKEGKGAAAAEFLPHSARLFCRTASHTRSTQLSQRVTIFNTIVFLYTQNFCHFYSTIWLHAFRYLSGHRI